MTTDHLMTGLLIVLFSGILIFICISRLKNFFPSTAFESFESLSEIKAYYKSAISIISKKRWLLLLPLFITLSAYFIKIPIFLYHRPDISSLSDANLNQVAYDFIGRISFLNFIQLLFQTPKLLDYGYHGSISGSLIFLGFFLICCVTFKAESKKLQRYSSEDNLKNVAYFEKFLKYSLFLLITVSSLVAIIVVAGERNNELFFITIYSLTMMLIGILSLSLFSLIEGFILFSVRGAILEEEQNFNMILNRSLRILRSLFLLNIIFAVIRYIPSAAHFPITVSAFLGIGQGKLLIRSILLNLAAFFTYFNSLVTFFAFCTPFEKHRGQAYTFNKLMLVR